MHKKVFPLVTKLHQLMRLGVAKGAKSNNIKGRFFREMIEKNSLEQGLTALKNLLAEQPRIIAITSHRNPDGDAIGSSLALYHFFKKIGHYPLVMLPSEYPDFLEWMPGIETILVHDLNGQIVERTLREAHVVFCLDFNALHRIDAMGAFIEKNCKETFKVLIDHHLDPEDFANLTVSNVRASSTCELVYEFIAGLMGREMDINQTIGTCILVGILTDTGSFRFSTTVRSYQIAAHLKEIGVDDYFIQDALFNNATEKQLRLLAHCLSPERMELLTEFHTGIIFLTKQDYEKYDIQRGDTEGIVNYVLRMKDMRFAVLITEQPKVVKLSLRSKGDFSVQELASRYFKGGGHKNASGGISNLSLAATIDKFKAILPLYKTQLKNAELILEL